MDMHTHITWYCEQHPRSNNAENVPLERAEDAKPLLGCSSITRATPNPTTEENNLQQWLLETAKQQNMQGNALQKPPIRMPVDASLSRPLPDLQGSETTPLHNTRTTALLHSNY